MLGQYSNGWGHAIVTVAVLAMVTILRVFNAIDTTTLVAICSPVIAFWFLTGTVNRFNPTASNTSDTATTTTTTNTTHHA